MPARRMHRVLSRLLGGGLCLALAGLLLYLSVPATMAALASLPGNRVVLRVQKGETVVPQELELVVSSRETALIWSPSARLYSDLGLGELLLAEPRTDGEGYDEALLARAMGHLRTALSRAPARPYVWTRLAYAGIVTAGASEEVARALEMALATAPHEPRLRLARLELCLLAWRYFTPGGQAAVLDQVRAAWVQDPQRVVELARHSEQANVVRLALLSSLDDLKAFNRLYRS